MKQLFQTFIGDTKGLAFVESALILPIMLTVLFGLFDLGQAIVIDQKITSASHMAADLITRNAIVTQTHLDDAVGGAQLVIDPYDRDLLGVDIVSIKFDEDNDPFVLWRHTHNMDSDNSLPTSAEGLGLEGEGVVAVVTRYTYTPHFTGGLFGDFEMKETSYMRGRRTSVVKYMDEEDL